MDRRFVEIPGSALFCFLVGYALWPPGRVYWTALADVVGEIPTVGFVMLVAGAVGVAIAALSDVDLSNLAVGGTIASVAGMALVETAMTPDSPVHFFLYGWLLGGLLLGAFAVRVSSGAIERAVLG